MWKIAHASRATDHGHSEHSVPNESFRKACLPISVRDEPIEGPDHEGRDMMPTLSSVPVEIGEVLPHAPEAFR